MNRVEPFATPALAFKTKREKRPATGRKSRRGETRTPGREGHRAAMPAVYRRDPAGLQNPPCRWIDPNGAI